MDNEDEECCSYPVGDCLFRNEKVNHPSHYQGNGLEVIDVIEAFALNFNLGNAIKYILRAGKKENMSEDLNKAIWYLNRKLEAHEKDTRTANQ